MALKSVSQSCVDRPARLGCLLAQERGAESDFLISNIFAVEKQCQARDAGGLVFHAHIPTPVAVGWRFKLSRLVLFGAVKNPEAFSTFPLQIVYDFGLNFQKFHLNK